MKGKYKKEKAFSKKLLLQESWLIWITTISLIVLAFICVFKGYFGELPWISAMVGFPWAAYGVSQSMYYKKTIAENTEKGIIYETALRDSDQASG